MAWYGSYSSETKVLDALIERKPTLGQLLLCPQFIPSLKLFHPKLLQYLSNSPTLPLEIISYLAISPSETDSVDRKFRLPLLTIEMIQSETTCIINSLLKVVNLQKEKKQLPAIVALFYLGLKNQEVLPLLAGYMQRTLLVFYRIRLREVIEIFYAHREIFDLLIENSSSTCVAAVLSLLLNLEITKSPPSNEDKLSCKLVIMRKIMEKMSIEWRKFCTNQDPQGLAILIFQNLANVTREVVQKYCLILDGKAMLDIILEEKHINLIIECCEKQSQFSYPAMDLILNLIRYYSFSAFNSEEGSEDLARKNMQRLESQYFVMKLNENFHKLLNIAKTFEKMTLFSYKLLQVLCHCMTLSSKKMFHKIKEAALYPTLIEMLFKHEQCNILHKLIERAFLHIFVTDKKIYELYKYYFFCEISIIDLTVNKILSLHPEKGLEQAIKKGYFGIFMKIVKIYSAIETTNEDIRQAITSKSQIWNKMSKKFIKPYELLLKDKLGQIQKNDELKIVPIEYTVRKIQNTHPTVQIFSNTQANLVNKAIKEIKEEEEKMPKTLELNSTDSKITDTFISSSKEDLGRISDNPTHNKSDKIEEEDSFFNVPDAHEKDDTPKIDTIKEDKKQASNFENFLHQKMNEADQQIRKKRSLSSEQRLGSAGKRSRMTSPSPRKKNSWKEQQNDNKNENIQNKPKPEKSERKQLAKDLPKIPTPSVHPAASNQLKDTNLYKSAFFDSGKEKIQMNDQFSKSMTNLQTLKRTKIVRIEVKPEQNKKYRKVEERDKPLLMYLGINC